MIHSSLLLLSKLRLKGQLRQLRRTLSSPKGIALTVISLGFLGMTLFPMIMARHVPKQVLPFVTWFLHPAALFIFWLATIAGSALKNPIAFTMPEVDFLFPGPFTRRELLIYKLSATLVGTLGFAAMMSLFLPWSWWPAVFLGFWLVATFMQWSAVLIALAVDWLGTRFQLLLAALAAMLLVALAVPVYESGLLNPNIDLRERLTALESSWAARVVLAPFVVFSRTISAQSFAELSSWGAATLAIDLAVAAAILKLDVNFLDASLAASRKRYEMLQRLKRSGGLPSLAARGKPRFGLPMFPRLFGAGVISWSQAVQMLRGSGRLIILLPAMLGPIAAMAIVASRRGNDPPTGIVIAMTMLVAFLFTTIVPLGVRTELDHVDTIKSLPISSQAIVWGSLGTAIVYITLVQLVVVIAACLVLGGWTRGASLAMSLAVPVNLLLVGSDSLLVLLFPAIRRFNPNDPLTGARMMLVNLAKMLFAAVCAAVAGAAVLLARFLFGESLLVAMIVGCGVMLIEGLLTAWIVALLFARFDPSAHLAPGE